MAVISTPDLCDANEGQVHILEPGLKNFGGRHAFYGAAVTIKCYEDNSLVKSQAATPGNGRILVVDGGGSRRRALVGDMIAGNALANGWAGFLIWGSVRDVDALAELDLGVQALGAIPIRSSKQGHGDLAGSVRFGGVLINNGDWVYADNNGVVVSVEPLALG
jgi:regulator of ribonuclease activity A